jgi:hypothetical protein
VQARASRTERQVALAASTSQHGSSALTAGESDDLTTVSAQP